MKIKWFHIFLIIAVISIFHTKSSSQISDVSTDHNSIKSFGQTIKGDVLYVFTTPFRMNSKDGLKLLTFTAITTGFITSFDVQTDKEFVTTGEDTEDDDVLFNMGKKLAQIGYGYDKISSGYILGGLTTSMIVWGIVCKDQKLLQTTRLMAESIVINEVITALSKGMLGRSRPYTGREPHDFNFFIFSKKVKYLSMPSGHTSGVFSIMTVIAKQYDQWWIKIPAYLLCVSVALQRIDDRQHWTSDVIVGGALGYWVGSTLVNRHQENAQSFSVKPYLLSNRVGVNINF